MLPGEQMLSLQSREEACTWNAMFYEGDSYRAYIVLFDILEHKLQVIKDFFLVEMAKNLPDVII